MKAFVWLLIVFLVMTAMIVVMSYGKKAFTPQTPFSTNSFPQESRPTTSDTSSTTVVAENSDTPWSVVFLPDRSMLVTERPGRVRRIDASDHLDPKPVATLSQVVELGEGGLLGMALDPKFADNHYLYLYYTYAGSSNTDYNRVVRMTYAKNQLTNEKILVDNIPSSSFHDGGRIKFGPDGYLYVTTGDAESPSQAQNKQTLNGKILRMTTDGKPAPGNPFGTLVYSYGHRNPQGLAWDSSGQLWETEHGRSGVSTGLDEINLIQPGKNYGWPIIQGDQTRAGMETPKRNSGPTTTWAPADGVFIGNSFFFAGLRGQTLYEAVISGQQVTDLKEHLVDQFGRIREVALGPDHMLYITTSNNDGRGSPQPGDDKVIRINPAKL